MTASTTIDYKKDRGDGLCPGTDSQKTFSNADFVDGAARRQAWITCNHCGRRLKGRIIKVDHGHRLSTPVTRAPRHKATV